MSDSLNMPELPIRMATPFSETPLGKPSTSKGSFVSGASSPTQLNISQIVQETSNLLDVKSLSILENIHNRLKSSSKLPSHFKDLDLSIEELKPSIKAGALTKEQSEEIYIKLKEKFKAIASIDSSYTWIQRADLLDALDRLIELCPYFSHLEVQPNSDVNTSWKEATIPLVPYSKIEQVTDRIGKEALKMRDVSDVQKKLKMDVMGEYTGLAKTIRRVSARELSFLGSIMNFFYRILTKFAGFLNQRRAGITEIADMSRKVGIRSFEILYKKTSDADKGVFYYRGPKYLFGRSIHAFGSVNDWFKRDLTPKARQSYLTKATDEAKSLEKSFGSLVKGSPLIISNSDCRLRFHRLEPGSFGQPQELTGKVLSNEAEAESRRKNDDSTYYAEKYKFTTKNLLGRESSDSMEARVLSDFSVGEAQRELLSGMFRAFEEEGAVQVIQRLAPADVHNYVAPLDGKPLSHKESVELLQKRLEANEKRLQRFPQDNHDKIAKLKAEIEHFNQLIKVFASQEQTLGRPSQSTIDIYGTNESVSTLAIQNQSRILAQNDRKIMLFQHQDGSFSMHVFIGATGVNKVDVDPSTHVMQQGDRQGDMQFGQDSYEKHGSFKASRNATTRDGQNKLKLKKETPRIDSEATKKAKMGENLGGFPINGSTVISYYLPSDFTIKPEIESFKERAVYGEGLNRTKIEILANMGDPILVKTEILMAQALEKALGDTFAIFSQKHDAIAATILKDKFQSRPKSELGIMIGRLSPQEQVLVKQAYNLLKPPEIELTHSESTLKKNLLTMVDKRLETLRRTRESEERLLDLLTPDDILTFREVDRQLFA